MAVSPNQKALIADALTALDVQPGGDAKLSADLNVALQRLTDMLNNKRDEAEKIHFNAAEGYTPEFGKNLSRAIAGFRSGSNYNTLKETFDEPFIGPKLAGALMRANNPYAPQAMTKDPAVLFKLLDQTPQIIAALDEAYTDGILAKADAPVSSPAVTTPPEPSSPAPEVTTPVESDSTPPSSPPPSSEPETPAPATPPEPAASSSSEPASSAPPLPPKSNHTVESATIITEMALQKIAPMLNAKLENAGGQAEGIMKVLMDLAGGGLTDMRIPEIAKVDGVFDIRAQASLQGLLAVLGHPMVMDFPGDVDWLYTPETGKYIKANLPKLKEKLKTLMSEEELKELDKQLSDDNVAMLIEALDFLHEQGKIAQEPLMSPDGLVVELPLYARQLFDARIQDLQNTSPENLAVMDVLTREYTGLYGLAELMDDDALADMGIDAALSHEERLKQVYKAALEKAESPDKLRDDLLMITSTISTLPLGQDGYRLGFSRNMVKVIDAAQAASANPDQAAQIFADGVQMTMNQLREEQGAPGFVHYAERQAPVWKPGLENFELQSGGQSFNALDVANAYDAYHKFHGWTDIAQQNYIKFTDDNGQMYLAAINKRSMVFSIEAIDVKKMLEICEDAGMSETEKLEALYKDPGFALAFPADQSDHYSIGYLHGELERMGSKDVPRFADFSAAATGRMEKKLAVDAREAEAKEAARSEVPAYVSGARPAETDSAQTGSTRGAVNKAEEILSARNPFNQSGLAPFVPRIYASRDQELLDYGQRLKARPLVIYPDDAKTLSLLQDYEGQELQLGATLGSSLRIKGTEISYGANREPLIAMYDKQTQIVRAVPMPPYMLESAQREQLIATLSGADTPEFMENFTRQYPELAKLAQNYHMYGPGQARDPEDHWNFKNSVRQVLLQVEEDFGNYAANLPRPPVGRPSLFGQVEGAVKRLGHGIAATPSFLGAAGQAFVQGTADSARKNGPEIVKSFERMADQYRGPQAAADTSVPPAATSPAPPPSAFQENAAEVTAQAKTYGLGDEPPVPKGAPLPDEPGA